MEAQGSPPIPPPTLAEEATEEVQSERPCVEAQEPTTESTAGEANPEEPSASEGSCTPKATPSSDHEDGAEGEAEAELESEAQPEPEAGGTAPTSHREALLSFFEVHNPASVPKVDNPNLALTLTLIRECPQGR